MIPKLCAYASPRAACTITLIACSTPSGPCLFRVRREVLAVDILHHQVVQSVRFAGVVGGDDVRMRQLRGDFDFLIEPLHGLLRADGVRRQHLERDDPLHPAMLGLEDLPHAAGTELVEHDVLAEDQSLRATLIEIDRLELRQLSLLNEFANERIGIGRFLFRGQARRGAT